MEGDCIFTVRIPPPEDVDRRQATLEITKDGYEGDSMIVLLGPYTEVALAEIFSEIMAAERSKA